MHESPGPNYYHQLLAGSYQLHQISGIWARPDFQSISYSDGDSSENQLFDIIRNAEDISVLSPELRPHCTDWTTLYHLSSSRANVLRPFRSTLCGDVLEIGAGCGAITRFLGESGANVLALEGSLRRAGIARSRTRDLSNVTVLAERFSDFNTDYKFDVVTLIGVLEYANLFTDAENAPLAMLRKVRSLLKPTGRLFIAIENQLGLKYFAGAHEDHVGIPMFGIEDRYTKTSVRTFGRLELTELLNSAGFPVTDFLACFPDYKLPTSIITLQGLQTPKFDPSPLASQSVAKDHLKPEYLCFSPELAWPSVLRNGLGLDLANSFLVVAAMSDSVKTPANILAYHYSSDRKPEFAKETVFVADQKVGVAIKYHSLVDEQKSLQAKAEFDQGQLSFEVPRQSHYVNGPLLSLDFVKLVTTPDWNHYGLKSFLQDYCAALAKLAGHPSVLSLNDKLPGTYLDCIPTNIIKSENSTIEYIDTEWAVSSDISVRRLLFRSLLRLTLLPADFATDEHGLIYSYEEFFRLCYNLLGENIDRVTLINLLTEEHRLHKVVSGYSNETFDKEKFLKTLMPHRKYSEVTPVYKNKADNLAAELHSIKTSRKWKLVVRISDMLPPTLKWAIRKVIPNNKQSAKKLPVAAPGSP